MTEKKKPKVIILESNDSVREHAASVLSKEGWDVTCKQVSKDALNTLAQSNKSQFALFISNFKLPVMEGDDILQKVKSISPLTQRMLLISADRIDTLISAINKAKINACITSPFNDDDLIYQAKNCFKQFKHTLKKQRLKRVTLHQNGQMVKIAKKLKKKENTYKKLIDEKKQEILKLNSKKKEGEKNSDLKTDISLSSLIEHKQINPTPDDFQKEFIAICKTIQDLFDKVTTRHNADPVNLDLKELLNSKKQENSQTDSTTPEFIAEIIKTAFTHAVNTDTPGSSKLAGADSSCTKDPVSGHDGKIKFYFETKVTNPGKITEDGSIDFRERGDIPFANKEDLLAVKTPPQEGKTGIDASGATIPADEVVDPVFVAGPGTEMSEDGLSIHAAIDGQPHLDALGTISINQELVIPGDVDFETGNIDFKGNIVVKGIIKEGFTIKGMNLTAREIDGGVIDVSGDLNVSAGINDSTISTLGNIYAKFINNSNIMGFGNIVISKEIIDSNIVLSGSCLNPTGHIISSKIIAKSGIEAGKIGTSSSKPAKLKVGVDKHIKVLKKQINEALEASVSKSDLLKDEIKKFEDHDQALYQQISEKAHIQDRAQLEIKELKDSDTEGDKTKEIKKIVDKAKIAEQELNTIFGTQDNIAKKIEQLKDQNSILEEKNKNYVIEKKALKDFSKKASPQPVVTVAKTITQDTIIKGPHSSIIIKEDTSRCKIQELASGEEGVRFYEMNISDL